MQVSCSKCSQPIAITDIIESNSGILSYVRTPTVLSRYRAGSLQASHRQAAYLPRSRGCLRPERSMRRLVARRRLTSS